MKKKEVEIPHWNLGSLDTHNIIFRNVEIFKKIKRKFVKENIAS
jgi:hypothetical protein